MREDLSNRFDRRRFAKGAVGLGLAAPALGALMTRTHVASALQEATPAATIEPIGEQLDLANLSPDVPEPTESVTISFASWVGDADNLKLIYESFQQYHPNIKVEFQG